MIILILIRSFSANTQPIWKRRDTRGAWKTQVCFYYYLTLIFNRYNWYVHITWPELPPMSVHYHCQLCLRKVLEFQNQAKNVPVGLLSSPKFKAIRSRGSFVMIGQPKKQTDRKTEIHRFIKVFTKILKYWILYNGIGRIHTFLNYRFMNAFTKVQNIV